MHHNAHRIQRNWGCRVREVVYQGIRMVMLENELLRIGVLAGKGADIIELNYKPRDLDFVWLSPRGVQNPAHAASGHQDPLAKFVETYPGGWQEVFPNGGAPSSHAGARYGQHDEVFALPWDVEIVKDTAESIAVRFSVRTNKVPCLIQKTLRLDSNVPRLQFDEQLTNTGAVPVRAMWGHHITFGPPFLTPGCRIRLPDGVRVIPHDEAIAPGGRRVANSGPFDWPIARTDNGNDLDLGIVPDRGTPSDIVYLNGFGEDLGWYEITDAEGAVGNRVEWDARKMPYLWYWQEFGATTEYPWYGQNYNIGLEPFSSYPTNGLAEAVENGSALSIGPGESQRFWLSMTVFETTDGGM